MKWIFNTQAKRFDGFDINGTLVAVAPLDGADLTNLPPNVIRGTAPPELVEYAKRYLGGDAAAGDELAGSLADWNERFNQATVREQQRTGTQPTSGQGALLPSPERLNTELDILQNAIDLTDATEKLSQKEQAIAAEAKRLGVPFDPAAVYGSGSGDTGPFPTTEAAISEVAATNPAYLAVLNRINNMAGVTELNRRQNALARFTQGLESRAREVDLNERVSGVARGRGDLRKDFQRAFQQAIRDPKTTEQDLSEMVWAYEDEIMRAYDEENRMIEAERPGYTAWKEGQAQQAINALPEHQRGWYNAREMAAGIRSLPDWNPTDRDPNNPNMKIPTNLNATQPQVAPVAPAPPPAPIVTSLGSQYAGVVPPTTAAPEAPPAGMTPEELEEWERRRRERSPEEKEADMPRFAGGGVFSGSSFGERAGANMSFNPAAPGRNTTTRVSGMNPDTQSPMPAWTSRQVQGSLMGHARQIQTQQMERQQVREAFAREKASIMNEFEQRKAAIAARWQAAVAQNPFIARVYNPQQGTQITPPAITYQPPAA